MKTQSGKAASLDDNAPGPGESGEIIPAGLLAAAATSLVGTGSGTAKTITSKELGPGSYKCYGYVGFIPTNAGTTVGKIVASVSEADNTEPSADDFTGSIVNCPAFDPGSGNAFALPTSMPRIVRVAAGQNKTVYLIGRAAFDQTMTAFGQLRCERIPPSA